MPRPTPPPVRGEWGGRIDPGLALRAIESVREALRYMEFGPPIIHRGPGGEVGVDVPLMYHGYALDRVHYDPYTGSPSPKGRPVRALGVTVDENRVLEAMNSVLGELRVLDAAEYRGPEEAWAVPLAWRSFIIAHVKVTRDGRELVPDYGLTEELRRRIL